jgi:hypothetical protein
MRKLTVILAVLGILLGMTTGASAQRALFEYTMTLADSAPGGDSSLDQYVLHLTPKYNAAYSYSTPDIQGFEGTIGPSTIKQQWFAGVISSPDLGSSGYVNLNTTQVDQDSHFLVYPTSSQDSGKTNDVNASTAPNEGGPTAGSLNATMALWDGGVSDWGIAQIVVADGTKVDLSAAIGSDSTGEWGPIVPEPATLGLLAVGVVGLIRRRK